MQFRMGTVTFIFAYLLVLIIFSVDTRVSARALLRDVPAQSPERPHFRLRREEEEHDDEIDNSNAEETPLSKSFLFPGEHDDEDSTYDDNDESDASNEQVKSFKMNGQDTSPTEKNSETDENHPKENAGKSVENQKNSETGDNKEIPNDDDDNDKDNEKPAQENENNTGAHHRSAQGNENNAEENQDTVQENNDNTEKEGKDADTKSSADEGQEQYPSDDRK